MGVITLPASGLQCRPRTLNVMGKHAHPGTLAGQAKFAAELTLASATSRFVAPARNPTRTIGLIVYAGQLMPTGWIRPSESNNATSLCTFDGSVTWRERKGGFPGQLLVTSTSRTPCGIVSPTGRVTTHCDWASA